MALDESVEFNRLNALRRYAILDTPPEGAFDRITALAADVLDVPISMVSFVDSNRVWFKSVHGPAGLREVERAPGLCGAQDAVYVVENASTDPRCLDHPLVTGPLGLEFYVGIPLKTHEGHVLGTLCCIDTRPRSITPRQQRYLETFAAIIMDEIELRRSASQISRLSEALADACSDMERRASIDTLTGVLSRAAMLERSAKLIERASANSCSTAILLLDIDNFKAVNDTYGHAAGDMVLREVAGRMASSCRGDDLLGRIGGEEFLAVFSDVGDDAATMIAERLRETVCQVPVPFGDDVQLDISVSGGLLMLPPSKKGHSLPEAMNRADRALYSAKSTGRNRVILVEDENEGES